MLATAKPSRDKLTLAADRRAETIEALRHRNRVARKPAPPKPKPWDLFTAAYGAEMPRVLTGTRIKPFMIGLREELIQRAPLGTRQGVRKAIKAWCGSKAYLAALAAEGAQRFDIDGRPVGAVTDDHRAEAASRLEDKARRARKGRGARR